MIRSTLISLIFFSSAMSNEKKDILDALDKYNNAFGEADYSQIVNFFDYPASFNLKNKTITAHTKFKLKLIYKKLRGDLPDYYSHSMWDKINIQLTDNNIAIVNANFSRYKEDGTKFYSGSAQYYLRFKDNMWKIFSLTPYKNIKTLD